VTNEQYSTAKKLKSDIDTLEKIYTEIKVNHGQTGPIKSVILRIDFEEFVHEEIIKLNKEFEKL